DVLANVTSGPANDIRHPLVTSVETWAVPGSVAIESGKVRYIPTDADYNGPDSFTYTIRDNGQTNGVDDFKFDTGTVNITVTEVKNERTSCTDTAENAEGKGTRTLYDDIANNT